MQSLKIDLYLLLLIGIIIKKIGYKLNIKKDIHV